MSDYDTWLERPYIDADTYGDAYENYCEAHGLDPDDPDSVERFEAAREREV